MSYRRKKRSTRIVTMKFQSFVDISTQADNMQIISVNAGGSEVLKRLAPFFAAYKYYKLGGVSIKLIPASTLPVDPLGLSYSLDDVDAVDPRDQLTPGMCRITNGEDILENITGLTGDQQRELYNNMLLDPRWYKWMLQSGVKRFGKPRYWQIGQLHQDKFPGANVNVPAFNTSAQLQGSFKKSTSEILSSGAGVGQAQGSTPYGFFQTGHRGNLGWLPTDGMQPMVKARDGSSALIPTIASPVEVELFKILMPPMRKTNYYYRMFITETVYFKEPIVMNINGYRPIDVFKYTPVSGPLLPTGYVAIQTDAVLDQITGGNDGSD